MRYAVYFTPPPDAPLTRLAAAWLRRDPSGREPPPFPSIPGLSAEEAWPLTAEPRRYGFHATLKAPFRLAPGSDEAGLLDAFEAFCRSRPVFPLPRLAVQRIGNFLAIAPQSPSAELDRLAADAVTEFEAFRAPLTQKELARRNPERLTPSQREHLDRWGYPYVFGDFRFHMTLTGPVPDGSAAELLPSLQALVAPELRSPLHAEGLALFVEPEPGADFQSRGFVRLGAR